MLHELQGGTLSVFDINLETFSKEEYNRLYNTIDPHAFITQQVPGKQIFRIFWNFVESPAEVFNLPLSCVSRVDSNSL